MYTFHEGYQRLLGTVVDGIPERTVGLKNLKPMTDLIDLTGKVAIVTGGAMGLGSCVVYRLCEAGAKVVIADVAEEYAEKALEFFDSKGYDVKFVKTDVRNVTQIKAAVDFTVDAFGKVDILVNNAALWLQRTLDELTEEIWDELMDINLKGTVFFVKEVAAQMEKQQTGGKIVNIASVAAVSADPGPFMFEYVASKSGVLAVTKSMARAMKPLGININCVIPGGMMTPGAINTQMTDASKALRAGMSKEQAAPVTDPDEVARAVFMLTTQISDYMHGSYIAVDGGAILGIS